MKRLRKALKKRKTTLDSICPQSDGVARRILEEYGAIFIATRKVKTPPVCVFTSEEQVTKFQDEADYVTETVSYADIELQPEAMKALLKARDEALKEGLDITPRDGAEAARRSYEDSMHLWDTRFLPALDHWLAQGRLTEAQVARLKSLPLRSQVAEVLELEKSGVYFSKDFRSRSSIRLPRPALRSTLPCSLSTSASLTIRACAKFWRSTVGFKQCLATCRISLFSD